MKVNKEEINKILNELSNINLSKDFENQSSVIANSLTEEVLSKLIQVMRENPEFQNEILFKKHLDVFISVQINRMT